MPINRFDGDLFQAGLACDRDLLYVTACWDDLSHWQKKRLAYLARWLSFRGNACRLWDMARAAAALACVYGLPVWLCLCGFVPVLCVA